MDRSRHVGNGSYREIISLAWPMVVSMLGHTIMNLSDTLMVAKLGTVAVAAVGLGTLAIYTLSCFAMGLLSGVQILVAQAHGAGDRRLLAIVPVQGCLLALFLGFGYLLFLPFADSIIGFLGGEGQVLVQGARYFRIRLWSSLPFFLSIPLLGYFQGIGNTRIAMIVTISANGLNILFDLFLIYGLFGLPAYGTDGAAYATNIAYFLEGVVILVLYVVRGNHAISLKEIGRLIKIGLPLGLQWTFEIVSWSVFTRIVAGFGDVHLAAHTIALRIISLSFMPGHGISEAVSVLVGQAVGACNSECVVKVVGRGLRLCLIMMGLFGLSFLLFKTQLIAVFDDNPQVIEVGGMLLIVAVAFQLSDGASMVFGGALNGAGQTRFVMIWSIATSWLVLLPLALLFSYGCNLATPGAWSAITLHTTVLALIFMVKARKLRGR